MSGIAVGGTAFVKVDGQQIPVRANAVVHLSQKKRTAVAGLDGPHGFTESPEVPGIDADITTLPGYQIKQLLDLEDGTVQLEGANGMVYVLRNAWQEDLVELDETQGTAKLKWRGMSIDEFEGVAA